MVLPSEILARWLSTILINKKDDGKRIKRKQFTQWHPDADELNSMRKEALKLSNALYDDPENTQLKEKLKEIKVNIKKLESVEKKI